MIRSRTFFDGSKGFVLFSKEYKKSEPFSYRKKVRILLLWCAGYYSNSLNALPDHVFAAQRGFYVGWMDTSGNWLYCQSIFSSATADDEPSYGY